MFLDWKNAFLYLSIVFDLFLVFIVLSKKQRRTETHIIYSLLVLWVIFWTAGIAMFRQATHYSLMLFWNREFIISAGFIASSLLYFSFLFPKPIIKLNFFKRVLIYIPNIFVLLGVLVPGILIKDVIVQSWGNESILGWGYIYFGIYFSIFAVWSFINLWRSYIKSVGLVKIQTIYVIVGFFVSLLFGAIFNLIFILLGNYRWIWLGPYSSFILFGLITYAIIRYRFLNIRLAFRRSFLKIILAAFAYGTFYGATWLFIKLFGSVWAKPALISGIFIAILFAVLWPLVEKLTLKFSNKYVYASIYTIQDTISNLTRQLTTIVNLNKIAASISNAMLQVMDIEKVAILVKEINKNNFKIQQIIGFNEKKILNINQKSVSNWLNEHKSALVQGEIALQAEDNPKAKEYGRLCRIACAMKKLSIELCLPLIVRDNLIGFILLGEKKSADAYTAEDIKLLETLSNQASIAVENALLYDHQEEIIAAKTRDLREKNIHLQKLLKMRSEFLDIASHQLRTPVSVIKGNLSMFLEGDFDKNPSAQKTALQSMFEKTEKLNSIINDILVASEVDTDNLNLSPLAQTVDVGQIAAKSIKFLQDRITAKKINFTFAPPREKLPVKSYERYLSIIIDNLLDNAITYTPQGGVINVVLKKEKEANGQEIIKFTVTDSGIGIPEADQKKLFDKFRRASNANNMKTDGTGIGLFIVKKLVTAHQGGELGFASQENKGSTFWFSLPRYE